MPVYGPWQDDNVQGVSALTDPDTLAQFSTLLTPYLDPVRPIRHVLGQDDLMDPQVSKPLLFPDWATAANVVAQVNGPVVEAPSTLPDEIAMYRVKVVMASTASVHGGMLSDRVAAFIATLPAAQQVVANIEWTDAPNLVVGSSFAQGFKAWEGLSDADWGQLLTTAVHMAL